ncbi:hypothetical protein [Patulibacter sp. SYSU D01012]|uniref:hypothetical protein n=1 Tax=Patulibacter sp. SYSU D01012 TaxID=2817381 RepID=UPI001B302853|nr:hypothetical protein [Patulibacter sp. SYSU D01012]
MRRHAALVRLQLVLVARGHRFVLPLTAYVIAMGLVFAPPVAPTLRAYGAAAALLHPLGAWLAIVMLGAESPQQRDAVAAAGGSTTAAWTARLVGVVLVLCLVAVGTAVLPAAAGVFARPPTPATVAAAAAAMVLAALPGGALGALCSSAFVPSGGWRFAACSSALLLTVPLTTAEPVRHVAPPGLAMVRFFDVASVPGPAAWWSIAVLPALASCAAMLAALAYLIRRLP